MTSFFMLRGDHGEEEGAEQPEPEHHYPQCALDGPHPHPVMAALEESEG